MERKIVKKILAILMIIMIMSADFYVLGSNLVTYALTLDSATNHANIEFSAYFKDEKGEKIDTLQTSIKSDNLKLYAEVTVKNDGYLNGTLELQNSNFNIKNNILSESVENIEGNKVALKQINAGTTAEIELDIEPIISDSMPADMLLSASDLKLTGKYMETSYKGISIEAIKEVTLNLQADASAEAELITDIITNKIFNINGTNKRVVQLSVKSRLTDNQYPIKQTLLNVNVPALSEKEPEEVSVLSLGTMATNGQNTLADEDWKYDTENKTVQITLKNEDSEIKWNKDVYDELVVTFIYAEDVDASKIEVVTNSEITVHNSETKYTAQYTKGIENQEPNEIITVQSEIDTEDIYKGQLYANINATEKKDIQYNTTTNLIVTNSDVAKTINIHEGPDVFATEGENLEANTKYISTQLNKEKMLEIIGQDGSITIKNGDTTITTINKDTEVDENGNIVINYENANNEIDIILSNIANSGMLEIQHSKAITENTYTREQLKTIKSLKTAVSVQAVNSAAEKVVENSTEASLELKETMSKAELTVNKESLSTMTTNNDVVLGIKLITDGVQYDLYKNPRIRIQLPSAVESVKFNEDKSILYAEGFTINTTYQNQIIEITLKGEQLEYPETSATQIYLQLNMDVTLSKRAPSKADKIVMTYSNENAIQYDGGTTDVGLIENAITISAPSGLITMHNSDTYNITGIDGTSEEKQLIQVPNTDAGKEVDFDITLVNNTSSNLKNVRILGKLPTAGNTITGEETPNSLETILKEITAANATIYYSGNVNATTDTENVDNGWSTTFNANAKVFLIKLEALNIESNYEASYKIQLPNPLTQDAKSYTEYKVVYDTDTETNLTAESVIIGFATPTELKVETNINAEVGNDIIKTGDSIKAGEVIRYTMSVTNNGAQAIKEIQLKSNVPEGTVYVVPEEDPSHSGNSYYIENEEVTEISTAIQSLAAGETYNTTYEVRVKSDLTEEKQISNKTIAVCGETSIESEKLTNKIVPSKLRVTIKNTLQSDMAGVSGGTTKYLAFIENLSNEDITDLELQLITENLQITYLYDGEEMLYLRDNMPEKVKIDKIPAQGNKSFAIKARTTEGVQSAIAMALVSDSEGNIYRSNKTVEQLDFVDAKISLTSPQNKANIREGNFVEYNITVENTGNVDSSMVITDEVSEYLEIQAVYVNDELKMQTTETAKTDTYITSISNNLEYGVRVAKASKATMKIVARVKNITAEIDATTISNKAEVKVYGMIKDTSEEVTHILKVTAEDIKNVVTGKAWLDENRNGAIDETENLLKEIKVKLYDVSTNDYAKDDAGNIIETTTNDKGEYTFKKIKNGKYIVLFEYDTNEYEPTYYLKEGVEESRNSKVVSKNIIINGQEKIYAVTDIINLSDNIANINIGLREVLIFDLQLNKYISRITVQNSKGTKTYECGDSTFEKIEIHKKQLKGTIVVLEYTIKVKNNGEIPGYANNIVDYLTSGLSFSSELNPDWYLLGEDLYTKKLSNVAINPGEEKEVKLILTKTMNEENTGVINNRAEIKDVYNEYGNTDINSTPGNNMSGENDLGSADVIIAISTGGTIIAYVILAMINTVLIFIAIRLMIKNNIIKIKKERR